VSGLGGKLGFDATDKWPGETAREWGRRIELPAPLAARAAALLERLG
jgi:4-hydroxy-3-polyprenylbenzoate decarboxylase